MKYLNSSGAKLRFAALLSVLIITNGGCVISERAQQNLDQQRMMGPNYRLPPPPDSRPPDPRPQWGVFGAPD
jgi:hypothetical protein